MVDQRFTTLTALRASAAALLCFGMVGGAELAQAQTRSTAQAEAIVLRPLAFFKDEDLEFGTILPSLTSAGTVRLQPNNTRTATNGIVLIGTGHQPARFTGLGSPNQRVTISVQSNSIFLTGPGNPMRVRDFEIGSVPNTVILTTTPLVFRIGTSTGAFNFPLGATLEVGANQAPGDYSGTFTINFNYL